jgi:hypothetical protein
VGAAGHAGVQGDPAGVSAHHLGDHHPAVGRRRREQPVDAVGGEADGGVEAERRGRLVEVVVDRLRHADHAQAGLMEVVADRQRAVTTDRDQRIDAGLAELVDQLDGAVDLDVGAVGLQHRVPRGVAAVGRAEDRAPRVLDPPDRLTVELDESAVRVLVAVQETVEAVADAHDRPSPVAGGERRRPDHGVEARGVAAAGTDGDSRDVVHSPPG